MCVEELKYNNKKMKKCKKDIKVGIRYYNSVGKLLIITKMHDAVINYAYVDKGADSPIYSMWIKSWLKHINNASYAISKYPVPKLYAIC